VGDGLVSQIPALIVSLAAGLLVSKGGTRGSADEAVLGQLVRYPRALSVAAVLMLVLSLVPGLPALPFLVLSLALGTIAWAVPLRRRREAEAIQQRELDHKEEQAQENKLSLHNQLRVPDIELCIGKQLAAKLVTPNGELASRVAKMRRKFARSYGFIIPEIKLSDDLDLGQREYVIKVRGTEIAKGELRLGENLIILEADAEHDFPGDEVVEPAFGMRAMWLPEVLSREARRDGHKVVDPISVLLTHLSEVVRANLGQLFSYKDQVALIDALEPTYRKLYDDICPSQITSSNLLAVFKLLLNERVSIRNLAQILEAIAEVAGQTRRPEQILEVVRMRLAAQICGDLAINGVLSVLRLGEEWEAAFHKSLRRDPKGEVVEFDLDPEQMVKFCEDLQRVCNELNAQGYSFVLVVAPEVRTYIRMLAERVVPRLTVLSHVEISRNIQIEQVGTVLRQ
jgi:flagellar biosynthesis protein FlhA